MFASVFFIVMLNAFIASNPESLLFSRMLDSRISEPVDLIDCLENIADTFAGRLTIILLEEEIRNVPWINRFLSIVQKPVIIVSFKGHISNLFGFYILFPEYRPEYFHEFWKDHVKSRFLAVWTAPASNSSLQFIFERFWSQRCTNIYGLVRPQENRDLQLYSFSPYSEGKCGFVKIILLDEWDKISGTFARNLNLYENNVINLHNCVLKVLCNHRPPDSIMKINLEMFEWEVTGVSEKLLEIAEKHFNFSSHIHSATYGLQLNQSWYYYNEELDFICDTVQKETVDFASGWFSYSAIEMDNLDSRGIELGTVTSIDCFGWIVPQRAGVKPPNTAYFTEEFGYITWILIFVTLSSVSLGLYCILRRSFPFVILLTIQTCFEQPVYNQSAFQKSSFRVLFSNFCFYSLVVSAAYKASFASFITVSFHGKEFSTVKEIIESPLKWYGSPNSLRVLNATISGTKSQTKKLLDDFNILPPGNFEDVIKRVIRQRDIAVFGIKRNMYYYSISEAKRLKTKIPFRFIPGCLIRPHTTHFLFKRGSFLISPFNRLLNRLFETGIASYWILHLGSNKILPAERLKGKNLRIQFFKTPFEILFIGYMISYFVFILELICHRISKHERARTRKFRIRRVAKSRISKGRMFLFDLLKQI